MREKTLRYPGHAEYIRVLRETGFFDNKPIQIKGAQISPLELTARVLFPHWQLGENEEEFTVMRILIEGEWKGKDVSRTYNLHDRTDHKTGLSSMARATGFTCAAVARLVLEGKMDADGLVSPEQTGMDRKKFDSVTRHLESKGIRLDAAAP